MDWILVISFVGVLVCAAVMIASFIEQMAHSKQEAQQTVSVIKEVHEERQAVKVVPIERPETMQRQAQSFNVEDLF